MGLPIGWLVVEDAWIWWSGRGWGDAMAEWANIPLAIEMNVVWLVAHSWMGQSSAQYAIAPDVPHGLRRFPYSVNTNTNPWTYASLRQLNEVHGASIYIASSRPFHRHCNRHWWSRRICFTIFMQLLSTLMGFPTISLQTLTDRKATLFSCASSWMHCLSNLVTQLVSISSKQYRSAYSIPEMSSYQRSRCLDTGRPEQSGSNKCIISKPFASRGLNADDTFVDDFSVPADCWTIETI